jgi:hypothetical protein|tara:strand:- start:116 stop:295 length:180 start_codon:yes stop_codon:yes gene_type:complete
MAGINITAAEAGFKGYGLVRNARGEPQFNDFNNIPEPFQASLTEEDWVYIETQQQKETT